MKLLRRRRTTSRENQISLAEQPLEIQVKPQAMESDFNAHPAELLDHSRAFIVPVYHQTQPYLSQSLFAWAGVALGASVEFLRPNHRCQDLDF